MLEEIGSVDRVRPARDVVLEMVEGWIATMERMQALMEACRTRLRPILMTTSAIIAGLLVARIGEGWCFFVNGVSYIAVIIGLLLMRVDASARASAKTPPLEHLKEGFQFVRQTAPIRALLLL